ncbi:MAG TPA: MBL fold metallo-hydrolase [Candidatus Saccharimonadales bacterium]|nr:MBL fold metallo-hydrolase [Candidatus Saccharimonadales bacterium]
MKHTTLNLDKGERLRRPSGIRSLTLGDTKISFVPDGVVTFDPLIWFPDTTDKDWAEKYSEYLDEAGRLVGSVGALLVERDGRALLIDAGAGPLTIDASQNPYGISLSGGKLLDSLAKLGRNPADIEAVAFTHLHIDHIGWAWHPAPGTDQPAFTNAKYLVSEPEWTQRHLAEMTGVSSDMLKAMEPRVQTIGDGEEIFPGVHAKFVPGHSTGHTTYVIKAGEKQVMAFGDIVHTLVQFENPDLPTEVDHDREQSIKAHRTLIETLAEPDVIGYGDHFPDMVFGHIDNEEGKPVWRPIDA